MALGDIDQSPTGLVSGGNVATFATPAFASAPTVGNTDVILAVSSATITTPSGYTLDESNVGFGAIYVWRRTVQAGDTGAAVTLTLGSSRPCAAFRLELEGTASIANAGTAHSNKFFNSTATTARSATAIDLGVAGAIGLLLFATDDVAAVTTWSAWSNSITQKKSNSPSLGTTPLNGLVAYENGAAQTGSQTISATSSQSSNRYQILALGYNFTGAAQTMGVTGFASPATFGTVALRAKSTLTVTGFANPAVMGSVSLLAKHTLAVTGFSAAATFGTTTLKAKRTLTVAGFNAGGVFGNVSLHSVGPQTMATQGFSATPHFGVLLLLQPFHAPPLCTLVAAGNPTVDLAASGNPVAALTAPPSPSAKVTTQ